jgi:L-2,4-diaminobutyric acid acetyltransferase
MLTSKTKQDPPLAFRKPRVSDGPDIYDLVTRSKPLDVNSRYNYLLLCSHFAETCAVVESEGSVLAFISAYCPPQQSDTLFVWQVAVDASLRGQGIAKRLIRHLLDRPNLQHIRFVEATVNPSNDASRNLFRSLARESQCDIKDSLFYSIEDFGGDAHEEEILLRVGPIKK